MSVEATGDADYSSRIHIQAPVDRVFALLTTLEGIQAWWEGNVSGDPTELGELQFGVHDSDDHTRVQVTGTAFPTDVAWSVLDDSGYGGEWSDTSMQFHLQEELDASTFLSLRHRGLTPLLDCYADCASGWDRRLQDIRQAAESASG
jgi:uncharacterized protein YndB with AHSA1/START domain